MTISFELAHGCTVRTFDLRWNGNNQSSMSQEMQSIASNGFVSTGEKTRKKLVICTTALTN
jgi:hypothetical protein